MVQYLAAQKMFKNWLIVSLKYPRMYPRKLDPLCSVPRNPMFKKNFEDLVSILSQVSHNFRLGKFFSKEKEKEISKRHCEGK